MADIILFVLAVMIGSWFNAASVYGDCISHGKTTLLGGGKIECKVIDDVPNKQ